MKIMKKKTTTANKNRVAMPKPRLPWQTGDYVRTQDFRFCLPYHFLLLCKLADTTPACLLADFMDDLACESWKREGREKTRGHLIDYFIAAGYGQPHYTEDEIRQLFKEMDAIGMLWPKNAKQKLTDLHVKWRDKYHNYWFKKWFKKDQRKL
jgi:hypothetical protein